MTFYFQPDNGSLIKINEQDARMRLAHTYPCCITDGLLEGMRNGINFFVYPTKTDESGTLMNTPDTTVETLLGHFTSPFLISYSARLLGLLAAHITMVLDPLSAGVIRSHFQAIKIPLAEMFLTRLKFEKKQVALLNNIFDELTEIAIFQETKKWECIFNNLRNVPKEPRNMDFVYDSMVIWREVEMENEEWFRVGPGLDKDSAGGLAHEIPEIIFQWSSKKFMKEPALNQNWRDSLIVNPIYKGRHKKFDSNTAFVIMPFSEEWSDRVWNQMIVPVSRECGLNPIRGDDIFGHDVMEDVWKAICESAVIFADVTGRTPNVMYELGIAHALGKPTVILSQNYEDIPFDLNRFRCIKYEDNTAGLELLRRGLTATVKPIINT